MRLILENINKIKNADIELNGLTVIAGANDSGKSTVGRVLFSVTKALINGLNNNDKDKIKSIKERFSSLHRRLSSIRTIDRKLLLDYFSPIETSRKFEALLSSADANTASVQKELFKIVDEKSSIIESLDIAPRHKSLALKDLIAIKNLLAESDDYGSRFRNEFQNQIESEFSYNICSVATECSEIHFYSDYGSAKIKMKENEIIKGHLDKDFDYSLTDVTFVETPLYLHLMDALYRTSTYKELENKRATIGLSFGMVSVHIKDLMDKLDYSKYLHNNSLFSRMDSFDIESIIGGHFVYDKKSKSLLLVKEERGQTFRYSPVNVASGIKSFGLVQLLLEMDFINESKMLIWDEPENHLHPQWQIEFAHLLVKLAKSGIPVVVSSHSPYFIQGIRYFSNEEKMDSYVNYYLAENEDGVDGLSEIRNVTDDLNQVFVKLAEPLNQIMNLNK